MGRTILFASCLIFISFVAGCENESQFCRLQEKDVYEYLWTKNKDLAEETLKLDFLKHMERGDLWAERYVNFTIQDIYYLVSVTDMLEKVITSVKEPDLKAFLQDRFKSYSKFRDYLLKMYHLQDVNGIKPIRVMEKYLADYQDIMNIHKEEPIYFCVALLPCNRLWVWLANNLNITETNAYYNWKRDNKDGHPEKYREVINKYITPDKEKEAQRIFRMQMKNEHDFFQFS